MPEYCSTCGERAVEWNPGNRVVQCHSCRAIAETVTLTRSELFQMMGACALPPFVGHPEADSWDCAPLASHITEQVDALTAGRWIIAVPQSA